MAFSQCRNRAHELAKVAEKALNDRGLPTHDVEMNVVFWRRAADGWLDFKKNVEVEIGHPGVTSIGAM